ncbi:hypothetical protein SAMN05443144_10448 [Fodinibius roseus]|uniref:Uncharacterized protein n=1 Tax=Fodinibius roseus TaxID=1194090 RepID=A0A1M4X7M2_9BACT|nr:hypothetical protein SAMN05443144_10448 [Fodinibius roseus]
MRKCKPKCITFIKEKIIFAFVIVVYGLMRLPGFVNAYYLAPAEQLTEDMLKIISVRNIQQAVLKEIVICHKY